MLEVVVVVDIVLQGFEFLYPLYETKKFLLNLDQTRPGSLHKIYIQQLCVVYLVAVLRLMRLLGFRFKRWMRLYKRYTRQHPSIRTEDFCHINNIQNS